MAMASAVQVCSSHQINSKLPRAAIPPISVRGLSPRSHLIYSTSPAQVACRSYSGSALPLALYPSFCSLRTGVPSRIGGKNDVCQRCDLAAYPDFCKGT